MPTGVPPFWTNSREQAAASNPTGRAAVQMSKAEPVRIPGTFEDSDTEKSEVAFTPPSSNEQIFVKSKKQRSSETAERDAAAHFAERLQTNVARLGEKIERRESKLARYRKKGPRGVAAMANVEQQLERMYEELSKAEMRLRDHKVVVDAQDTVKSHQYTPIGMMQSNTLPGPTMRTHFEGSATEHKHLQRTDIASKSYKKPHIYEGSDDEDDAFVVRYPEQSSARRAKRRNINFTTEDTLNQRPSGVDRFASASSTMIPNVTVHPPARTVTSEIDYNELDQAMKEVIAMSSDYERPQRSQPVPTYVKEADLPVSSINPNDAATLSETAYCTACDNYGCDSCKPNWFDTLLHDQEEAEHECNRSDCYACNSVWAQEDSDPEDIQPESKVIATSHASANSDHDDAATPRLRTYIAGVPQAASWSALEKLAHQEQAAAKALLANESAREEIIDSSQGIDASSQQKPAKNQVTLSSHFYPAHISRHSQWAHETEPSTFISAGAAEDGTQEPPRASDFDPVTTFMQATRGEFLASEAADILNMCHGRLGMADVLYKSAGAAFVREMMEAWQSENKSSRANHTENDDVVTGNEISDDEVDSRVSSCDGCAFGCVSCYPMMKSARYKTARSFNLQCQECDLPRVFVDRDSNSECLDCEWYKPVARKARQASSACKKTDDMDTNQAFVMPSIHLDPYTPQKRASTEPKFAFAATAESVAESIDGPEVTQSRVAKYSVGNHDVRRAFRILGLRQFETVDQTTLYHQMMERAEYAEGSEYHNLADSVATICRHQNDNNSWYNSLTPNFEGHDPDVYAKQLRGPVPAAQIAIAPAFPKDIGDWWTKAQDKELLCLKEHRSNGPWIDIAEELNKSVAQCKERFKLINSSKSKFQAKIKKSKKQAKKTKGKQFGNDTTSYAHDTDVNEACENEHVLDELFLRENDEVQEPQGCWGDLGGIHHFAGDDWNTADGPDANEYLRWEPVNRDNECESPTWGQSPDAGAWEGSVRDSPQDCNAGGDGTHDTGNIHTTAEPAAPTAQAYTVTYWASVQCGDRFVDIAIDSKDVSGPDKSILYGPAKKVWKWVQEKGLTDKVSLQDAFDLAKEMSDDNNEVQMDDRSSRSLTPEFGRAYKSPTPPMSLRSYKSPTPLSFTRREPVAETSRPHTPQGAGRWGCSNDNNQAAGGWGRNDDDGFGGGGWGRARK